MHKSVLASTLALSLAAAPVVHADAISRLERQAAIATAGALVFVVGAATTMTGAILATNASPNTTLLEAGERLSMIDKAIESADRRIPEIKVRDKAIQNLKSERRAIIEALAKSDVYPDRGISPADLERLQQEMSKQIRKNERLEKTGMRLAMGGAALMIGGVVVLLTSPLISNHFEQVSLKDADGRKRLASLGIDSDEAVSKAIVTYTQEATLLNATK